VDTDTGSGNDTGPPVREITVNQAVAWNIAWLRRAAGLTQDQLGDLIGWTGSKVSEAERSFDGKRVREFNAQELAVLAVGLGVPIAALLMPPDAEGCAFRDGTGGLRGMPDLFRLAIPDNDDGTAVMIAYRERWNARARRWLADDPRWLELAARWVGNIAGRRVEVAARLRKREESLRLAATELGDLAGEIERGGR
jgi:transcriptional regulator with XRE-family HTH domain